MCITFTTPLLIVLPIIYTNNLTKNLNNNLELIFNKELEFDKCTIELKLLEDSLFYNTGT
jgi:hypothetical protein